MVSVSKLLAHSWWKLSVIIITKCIIWKLLKVGKANSVITIIEHPFIICQVVQNKRAVTWDSCHYTGSHVALFAATITGFDP